VTEERIDKIEDNRVVALRYTLSDTRGGEVLDEATESEPLLYLHGHGNLVPGLEQALAGREVGHTFEVELPPDEAFGPASKNSERVVPRDAFPEDLELEPGLELALEDDDELFPIWIKLVDDERVVIDLDHPFAGKTVRFTGEVLRIREATADELEHGHPHGLTGEEGH
jgi:FKBP-type peptidyl-prolyl cis-trans isomerase SlyD